MVTSGSVLFSRFTHGLQKLRSSPYEWFVLVGGRLVLTGVLSAIFAAFVVALHYTGIVIVTDTTQMLYLFQALVAGNLTLITIILSINQLVLSRELKTPGELHDQIEAVIDYRNRVTELSGEPIAPLTPTDFLSVLLAGTRDTASRLDSTITDEDNTGLAADVDALVAEITDRTDHISGVLDRSQGGLFGALAVTLETNFSYQLNEAFRIQTVYSEDLSPTAHQTLEDLIQGLKQVDIARQYFKSIYIQSELARLSKVLLYVGVPAVGSALLLLIVYASTVEPPLTVNYLRVVVPSVVILGFLPLAVLFSFVLRIATIAQHTVAITPFTTPTQETSFESR